MSWLARFWNFLKEDTWQSWIVSLVLLVVGIRFVFFPLLSFATGSPLPLVVIESCSLYHGADFDSWWERDGGWYDNFGISRDAFESFDYNDGMTKGDIILVWGRSDYDVGDVIIFETEPQFLLAHPIIHRIVSTDPLSTKGDNGLTNTRVFPFEEDIDGEMVLGKAVVRVPVLGWLKLILFEPFREPGGRGTCSRQMRNAQLDGIVLN